MGMQHMESIARRPIPNMSRTIARAPAAVKLNAIVWLDLLLRPGRIDREPGRRDVLYC